MRPPFPLLIRVRGAELVRSRYHLKDVIVGKIYFLLVRIKIKHMELSIIRRETTGAGASPLPASLLLPLTHPRNAAPNQYNESETITKFEIMDGAPVRGATRRFSVPNRCSPPRRRDNSDPAVPRWL